VPGCPSTLAISRGLGVEPKEAELLILDEPTAGLDPLAQQVVHDLILAWCGGGSVLLSPHILGDLSGRRCWHWPAGGILLFAGWS
jgi:ABC-type multidrug transport system ATPase subunit